MEANILVTEIAQTVINPYYTVGFVLASFTAMVCLGCVIVAEATADVRIVLVHFVLSIVLGLVGWNLYSKSSQLSYRVFGYNVKGIPVVAVVDHKPTLETWVDAQRVAHRFTLK